MEGKKSSAAAARALRPKIGRSAPKTIAFLAIENGFFEIRFSECAGKDQSAETGFVGKNTYGGGRIFIDPGDSVWGIANGERSDCGVFWARGYRSIENSDSRFPAIEELLHRSAGNAMFRWIRSSTIEVRQRSIHAGWGFP